MTVTDEVTGCLMVRECDALLLGEYFLTLWRIIVLSCVRNHSSNSTEPRPRSYESSTILLWEYQMSQHVMISVERGGLFSVMVIILSVCISTGINWSSQNFCLEILFVMPNCDCCFRGSDPCWGKDHRGGENAYYWRWAAALVNFCKFMLYMRCQDYTEII